MQISSGAATCWVPGKPGKGKSSFAHLRDILLSKTNDFHLIYFHCSARFAWFVAAKGFS